MDHKNHIVPQIKPTTMPKNPYDTQTCRKIPHWPQDNHIKSIIQQTKTKEKLAMTLILFGNEKQYKIEITQTKEDSKFYFIPFRHR